MPTVDVAGAVLAVGNAVELDGDVEGAGADADGSETDTDADGLERGTEPKLLDVVALAVGDEVAVGATR